ncbi:hypothetical protein FHS21_003296 [Phyllobacterium trifolii]|uniref:Uncharacterized protein n=1 Tax=Phyllobacterium trifolii TaxID=300193 RepID=A0A839UD76_9HYPH|nr:hypothetical protein [Phyllobacterium trifolii]
MRNTSFKKPRLSLPSVTGPCCQPTIFWERGSCSRGARQHCKFLEDKPGWTVQKEAVFPTTKQPQYTEPLLKTYLADLAKARLPKN